MALPSKSSAWMITIPLLLVCVMAGVIFFLVKRQRRLSNSFSRFANSHYDTKTGATRIGDAIDDQDEHHRDIHDHHDVPRFDDDERLIIT